MQAYLHVVIRCQVNSQVFSSPGPRHIQCRPHTGGPLEQLRFGFFRWNALDPKNQNQTTLYWPANCCQSFCGILRDHPEPPMRGRMWAISSAFKHLSVTTGLRIIHQPKISSQQRPVTTDEGLEDDQHKLGSSR
ncbi:hypothetical protein SRHO_G00248840 [Serrasalmus rhombeus]